MRWSCLLVLAACLGSVGCGGRANVSGKVTFTGKPLVSGMVSILASDGKAHYGEIMADGAYAIPGVALGEAKFSVACPNPTQNASGGRGKLDIDPRKPVKSAAPTAGSNFDATKWFAIPGEFGDPDRAGLKFTLTSGSNILDLPLPASPQPKE